MKQQLADIQSQLANIAADSKKKVKVVELSDSEGEKASPMKPNADDPDMRSAADMIFKRLQEHERLVDIDRALGAPMVQAVAPQPGHEEKPTAATGLPIMEASRLKETLRDPRERVVEQLEKYRKDSTWSLPPNISERVAPALLLQVFSSQPSANAMTTRWIQEKQQERNHVAHEMVLLCIILDKSLLEDPQFSSSESCEIVCRRIYALKKAFEAVNGVNSWKQPNGGRRPTMEKQNALGPRQRDRHQSVHWRNRDSPGCGPRAAVTLEGEGPYDEVRREHDLRRRGYGGGRLIGVRAGGPVL